MNRIRNFIVSRAHAFGHAFRGWWYVVHTQRNAWIHAVVTTLVLLVAFWLRLPMRDWAVLLLTIALVWTAEFINTALGSGGGSGQPAATPTGKGGQGCGCCSSVNRCTDFDFGRPAHSWAATLGEIKGNFR